MGKGAIVKGPPTWRMPTWQESCHAIRLPSCPLENDPLPFGLMISPAIYHPFFSLTHIGITTPAATLKDVDTIKSQDSTLLSELWVLRVE